MLQNTLLETIQGSYRDFSKLVPGTRRHVDELWNDRLVNPELRNKWFYTADGAVYFTRDGKPYFAITRERSNPAFKNLDEAYKQLGETRNYRVPEEDLESALADPETELFELSKLNWNNSLLELSTKNPELDSLSEDGRRLIHRVYGKDNFDEVMSMLAKRWSITRTYVLNPDYVREHASAGAFGRASWLWNISFYADDYNISGHYRLRGVVQSESAGESNSDRAKKRGRLSVFKGMEGGELSVIGEGVGGLTVTSEEPVEEKRYFWKKILRK
ncbi:MAG: hypothetical protein Q8Q01_03270 [archaeon]|nr:hypothetical protein [archaeon]